MRLLRLFYGCLLVILLAQVLRYCSSRPREARRGKKGSAPRSRPRVIYTIFAGRMWFMRTHLLYTDELLARGLVDEVHIWDFCENGKTSSWWRAMVKRNQQFLWSFFNATGLHPGYKYFKGPSTDRLRLSGGFQRGAGYIFESYYDYYSSNHSRSRWADHDLLIKADDDVVFIDLQRFPAFLSMVRQDQRRRIYGNTPRNAFYFANIVNNDVGLAIQGSRLLHRESTCGARSVAIQQQYLAFLNEGIDFRRAFTQYFPPETSNESQFVCPVTSPQCNATSAYWPGGFFDKGSTALAIHREFLSNPPEFLRHCVYHVTPLAYALPSFAFDDPAQRLVAFRRRVSVNFFAITMATARQSFALFLDQFCCDDEGFVGRLPTLTRVDHIVDAAFGVVHYAFAPQYRSAKPADLHQYEESYHSLALRVCNQTSHPSVLTSNASP